MGIVEQNPGIGIIGQFTTSEVTVLQQLGDISPVTGDLIYYDGSKWTRLAIDTTNKVLTVIGGIPSWQPAAKIKYFIASSTSPAATQLLADYVCDGIADDVQINAAIAAILAAGTGGGVVELSEGQFNLAASINLSSSYISVHGQGIGATLVKTQAGSNANPFNITGTGTIHVNVRRLQIDCNSANNTFGSGIHINTPWQNYDAEHIFEDLLITNCNNNGVEVAASADTRAMFFSRVHVKGASGNGFYFPWPSMTDCILEDCITDTIALNGFYIGGANNHFSNCKAFYCGSAGGENMGFFILGYNNYFENCEAQDNYQSGFYGNAAYGDPTYANFGCTFVNCIADSNGQNGGSTYAVGFQGIGVKQWQIIGGIAMVRPYPSFTQRIGISFEGGADQNYVSGTFLFANTTNYSDTATGTNVYLPGPGASDHLSWETIGALDVRHFGAKGDCKRIFGAVASSGSKNVTVAGASFTSADVGKKVLIYKEQFYGVITTIATVTDATHIVLTANAGATTTSGTGYIVYGTDDSTVIQKVLTYAATMARTGSTTDSNQPIGSGRVRVLMPGNAIQSMYMLTSQITIPVGVILEADGKVANMLANRNTPCILMQAYTSIDRLELENLGGTGILAGSANSQQQIAFGKLRIWHGIGAQTSGTINIPTTVAATPSLTGGTLGDNTYYYVVTAIDSTGGESLVSAEVTAVVSGATNHGSVALTWDAFAGAASYRIYRGLAAGIETGYFTSVTNSYTDTNASITADYPTPPGYGIKLIGNEYKIDSVFIKECSTGIYHHSGTDFICDSAFLVGCGTPIRERAANQTHYSHVFFDSCGSSSLYTSLGGFVVDDGCSNISANVQEFTLSSVSRSLTPVVNIGFFGQTVSKDIQIRVQANNSGGTGVSLAYAQDVDVTMLLSNAVFSSGATNPILTAVVYGTNLTNEIAVRGTISSGITPSTGTQVGGYTYQQGGVIFSGGSALDELAPETPPEAVNGSQLVFTVTAQPQWVVADGVVFYENAGYTYSNLKVTMSIAPSEYIRAIIPVTTTTLIETPTGSVNASNTVFAVTRPPTSIIADGITYFEGQGYTYAALQITMSVAPSEYIRSTMADYSSSVAATPTGTVNSSNAVFTVTTPPRWVISDGIIYFEGAGYSYANFQITLVVPPSEFIRVVI